MKVCALGAEMHKRAPLGIRLWRVQGPAFTAAVETTDLTITHAAPILKWAIGKHIAWFCGYAEARGWTCVEVPLS